MKSLLFQFYNGELDPSTDWNPMDSKEYREKAKEAEKLQNRLMELCGSEAERLWDDYIAELSSMSEIAYRLVFRKSFCLGLRVMQEAQEQTNELSTLKEPDFCSARERAPSL